MKLEHKKSGLQEVYHLSPLAPEAGGGLNPNNNPLTYVRVIWYFHCLKVEVNSTLTILSSLLQVHEVEDWAGLASWVSTLGPDVDRV